MSDKNTRKIPKIIFAIPIVIAIAVILNITFDGLKSEDVSSQPINSKDIITSMNEHTSSANLYSGPFAVLDESYGVDDTVFFIGSEIPLNSKGDILFIRPDGKTHHKLPFDGAKSAVNHYFTPVSSMDLKECTDCDFFGTWEISFRPIDGPMYSSIFFEVEYDLKEIG